MTFLATTRGALLRGETTEDALGDEVEDNGRNAIVKGFENFPLSIIERGSSEFDQASNQWRSIRILVGRVPANVPVDEGDRIKDLRDGAIYALDNFKRTPRGISGQSSVSMTLRRTTP